MSRLRRYALGLALLALVCAASASAEERFPPPDFTSGYQMPATTQAAPRAGAFTVLDVAVLAVALSLAAFLAFKVRSRRWLFLLMAGSLLYFGFYRKGCICPIGAIQNVTLAVFTPGYLLPWAVAVFFLLPLVFALFCGRIFCSAVCPLGAIQDVFLLKPLRLAPWLEHGLGVLPYVYLSAAVLYAATGTAFLICEYDPFVAFFRLDGSYNMLLLGASLLIIALFVGRPYCRFLCPYGVLLRWLSPLARWRIKIHPQVCIQCRLCEEACPFGAIQTPTPEPDPARRLEGKVRLAALLVLLPALVAGGAWAGYASGAALARLNFTVALAERIWAEDHEQVQDTTNESEAFRKQARPAEELYAEAETVKAHFRLGGALVAGFLGLVVGLKLMRLSLRRRQIVYEADMGSCLACGRCYLACPGEHERLGLVGAPPTA